MRMRVSPRRHVGSVRAGTVVEQGVERNHILRAGNIRTGKNDRSSEIGSGLPDDRLKALFRDDHASACAFEYCPQLLRLGVG